MGKGWYEIAEGRIYGLGGGKLATGYTNIGGNYYYFNERGIAQTYHNMIDGEPYYFFSDGTGMGKGWYEIAKGRIYGLGGGKLATGYIEIGNLKCNFDEKGILKSSEEIKYSIMGNSNINKYDLVNLYKRESPINYPSYYQKTSAQSIEKFCQIYIEEASAEGVKAEVAFCQAMHETGWLKFGGQVSIEQFNFAGLGATDGGASGASFPNVRTGIRAHIQHLKAYANNEPLKNTCVDPRFGLVKRGSAPYVEWLGQKENPYGYGWATSLKYGYKILKIIDKL